MLRQLSQRRSFSQSLGIVGLPNTGKSTLFNALTRTQMAFCANYPFATIEPCSAKVPVPEPVLTQFATLAKSEAVIESQIEFVDIAGLVKGAHKGEGLGNQFLSTIRECSAIVNVVRCFDDDDIIHVDQDGINPIRDLQTIRNELTLSDLAVVERRMQTNLKKRRGSDVAAEKMDTVLKRCANLLENNCDVTRSSFMENNDLSEQNLWETAKSLNLLSSKPVIYVCNVDENGALDGNAHSRAVRDYMSTSSSPAQCFPVCIKLEEEAAGFSTVEAQDEYLELAGLESTSLRKIISASYSLLSLHTFYTIGRREARSWAIPIGCTAKKAAGCIHSDFEDRFIRAEIISANDFPEYGSFPAARKAGKARQEGKDYIVQSGDVILFS